jgi:hypothetical protein
MIRKKEKKNNTPNQKIKTQIKGKKPLNEGPSNFLNPPPSPYPKKNLKSH